MERLPAFASFMLTLALIAAIAGCVAAVWP